MRIGWTRLTAAALALPALAALTGAWLLTAWADALPDPVAVHFGPSGTADGFASLAAAQASLLFGPAIAVLMVVLTGAWTRRDTRTVRPAVAISSGVGTFVVALVVLAIAPQRGLVDAAAAHLTWWSIPASVLVGLVAAVLAAVAVPRVDPEPVTVPPPPDATRVDLNADERLAWVGTGRMPIFGTLLIALIPLGVAILLAVTLPWSAGALVALLLVALTGVVVTVLIAAPVEARADDIGITVRSMSRCAHPGATRRHRACRRRPGPRHPPLQLRLPPRPGGRAGQRPPGRRADRHPRRWFAPARHRRRRGAGRRGDQRPRRPGAPLTHVLA